VKPLILVPHAFVKPTLNSLAHRPEDVHERRLGVWFAAEVTDEAIAKRQHDTLSAGSRLLFAVRQ